MGDSTPALRQAKKVIPDESADLLGPNRRRTDEMPSQRWRDISDLCDEFGSCVCFFFVSVHTFGEVAQAEGKGGTFLTSSQGCLTEGFKGFKVRILLHLDEINVHHLRSYSKCVLNIQSMIQLSCFFCWSC